MTDTRRFTGRQITTMVVALSVAIGVAPAGAVAASNVFSISDPSHPSRKAHVSATGGLAVTAQDGKTGTKARVDKSGRTVVGDGSGALTVDGKVNVSGSKVTVGGGSVSVNGTVRAYAPAATWHFSATHDATWFDLTPPRSDAVNLTSLSFAGDTTSDHVFVGIYAGITPVSATADCMSVRTDAETIWQGETGGSGGGTTPVFLSFPTPLVARPAKGQKMCYFAYVGHSSGFSFNASGYYGG